MMLDSILKILSEKMMTVSWLRLATRWLYPVSIQVQQKHIFGFNNWAHFAENVCSLYTEKLKNL